MSIREVKAFFAARGMEDKVLEFATSSATVELAAQTVGVIPARIAKTLSFMTAEGPLLVVTAGDAKIDNHKYKETFSCKAKMLTPEEAVELVGHAVGGVCPFAVKPGVKTCLDVSLQRFTTVFPACGSSNSAIELTCEELEERLGDLRCRGVALQEGQTLQSLYEERIPLYEKYADIVFEADNLPIREIVRQIKKKFVK